MSSRRCSTHDQQIVEMYQTGLWSMEDLAKEFHFSRTTIMRRLRAAGVEAYPRGTAGWRHWKLPYDEVRMTVELYIELGSYSKVAERLGVSRETVRDRIKRYEPGALQVQA